MPSTPSSTRWCRTPPTTTLLKSRRQELHGKIARVIEQRFPNVKATEPEVLAHHLTAAGLAEAAIPLWQAAGELALKRMAADRGHLPSQPRARTGFHPALVIATRRQRTGAAPPALAPRGWRSKAGPLRKSGPACIRHLPWRSRSSATTRCCHLCGTGQQRHDARARSGVPALGAGDAGRREGDRRR